MNRRHTFGLLAAAAALCALPGASAWAAEDPPPEAVLAALLGQWQGTMSYHDPAQGARSVNLPTRLYTSLIGPDEVALYFVYADGAGKSRYGYERLRFEFASDTLIWIRGAVERTALVGRIVSSTSEANLKRYVVDTTKDGVLTRYTFEFSPSSFTMTKDEMGAGGQANHLNRYTFQRPA